MESSEDILRANLRRFLEEDPLYHPVTISGGFTDSYYWPQKITLWCPNCKMEKTFRNSSNLNVRQGTQRLEFRCADCEKSEATFYILGFLRDNDAATAYVKKIGQHPSWRIEPSREMRRFLKEEHEDLYKKALVCLSQSYGLGALAYLRRIIEDTARQIILLIEEVHKQEGASEAELQALKALSEGKDAESLLKSAAEMLPNYLKPGGENPLDVLYGTASSGIHRATEEECVKRAMETIAALEYLVPALLRHIDSKREYTAAMSKLRNRK